MAAAAPPPTAKARAVRREGWVLTLVKVEYPLDLNGLERELGTQRNGVDIFVERRAGGAEAFNFAPLVVEHEADDAVGIPVQSQSSDLLDPATDTAQRRGNARRAGAVLEVPDAVAAR